jgi:hypothetical protein
MRKGVIEYIKNQKHYRDINKYISIMDNKKQYILCSGKNCNKTILSEWDEYGLSYIRLGTLQIDDDDKCEKLMLALNKTRIFCKKCCDHYIELTLYHRVARQ